MDFCTNFNAENSTCSACDDKHYLSNGLCCAEKQFAAEVEGQKSCVSSTASQASISNCLKYVTNDNGKCAMCLENYYVSPD